MPCQTLTVAVAITGQWGQVFCVDNMHISWYMTQKGVKIEHDASIKLVLSALES